MATDEEWSIQELARTAGTTSRTLRHYHDVGLLRPSRLGANGYRYYDQASLVRLQRILLLRELGLGLNVIAEVLAGQRDTLSALDTHLELLEAERERLGRQIESVRTTLRKRARGERLMAEEVFDGFDHSRYEEEVIDRWGREAYRRGDDWWRSLSEEERARFGQEQIHIASDFATAMKSGLAPDSGEVQAITQRQFEWIVVGWQGNRPGADAFSGLGEMYVSDPRFTENYDRHGEGTAKFIRDAMKVYADRNLD